MLFAGKTKIGGANDATRKCLFSRERTMMRWAHSARIKSDLAITAAILKYRESCRTITQSCTRHTHACNQSSVTDRHAAFFSRAPPMTDRILGDMHRFSRGGPPQIGRNATPLQLL